MVRMYHCLVSMPDNLLTKKIFLWDLRLTENQNLSTWTKEVKEVLNQNDSMALFTTNIFDVKTATSEIRNSLHLKDQNLLENKCKNSPKLRTYNTITEFSSDKSYLSKPLSFVQRKFLTKLRLGVLPIRIETGRYERPRKKAFEWVCKQCNTGEVENEIHFLLKCPRHAQLRTSFLSKIADDQFTILNVDAKFKFLLNCPALAKITAQFIIDAFDNRLTE